MPRSLAFLFLFAVPIVVFCSPFKLYNQRQDGGFNVHAQLDNFIIVLVPTSGVNWVDIAGKASRPYKQGGVGGGGNILQIFNRTPPLSSPYKVDIDKSNVPLDRVSEDAAAATENETFDPQIRDDNAQPVMAAQSQDVKINSGTGGGNTNNNEVIITKQNNPFDEASKHSDDNNNDEAKKTPPQETEKVQENEDSNQTTEDSTTKDSTENKLVFTSTVTAHLDLIPDSKIVEAPTSQKATLVQESPNVIKGKAVSAAVKNARFLNASGEKRVKMLQFGLEVCSPGQRLTPRGHCVDLPTNRQSRDGDLARLLSSLRFGLSPAST